MAQMRKRKTIPNVVDTLFRSTAQGQHTHSARTKTSHHRTWCSYHPLNLRRRNKVNILPSNSPNRRSNDISNTSNSNQSVPDKFHQPKQFQNTLSSSNSGAVISSYFRSELDLSITELPEKDIKILNLLVKK